MERHYRIVEALLAKTVARGCTPGEAEAAKAKAEQIIKEHNLDRSRLARGSSTRRTVHTESPFGFGFDVDPRFAADFLRQAAAAAAAYQRRQDEARRQREAKEKQKIPTFKSIGEAARHWLTVRVDVAKNGVAVASDAGMPYYEVLRRIKLQFPDCKTSVDTLRWYESQLRREGKPVPKRWDPKRHWKGPQ